MQVHYILSIVLVSSLVTFSFQFDSLSSSQVEDIEKKLRSVIGRGSLATAVRLNFHDCVGGCNGCLNVEDVENAGLADIIADLDSVYTENGYDSVLSRADFWALGGMYSVDKAITNANDECDAEDCEVPDSGLVFQWGRVDCDTAPYTDSDDGLPSATMGHDDVMGFFATEFGFDANETVALMGAHTLGKASSGNSGFSGVWINGEGDMFNNEYYKRLVDSDLDWKHRDATRNTNTTHWQWNVPGSTFMLDVDVCLYKDIIVDDDGKSSCDFSTCEDAPTASAVEAFAASNDVWIPAFTSVYTKMLAHGATELNDLS